MREDDNEWADASQMAKAIDKRIHALSQEAKLRNEDRLSSVFGEIEKTLRVIMEKSFVVKDLHCQNLIAKIARAGDPEVFIQRVVHFDNYVKKITATTLDEKLVETGNDAAQLVNNTKAQIPERPAYLKDEDDIATDRMRLQLK